jgi:hypothetical protein
LPADFGGDLLGTALFVKELQDASSYFVGTENMPISSVQGDRPVGMNGDTNGAGKPQCGFRQSHSLELVGKLTASTGFVAFPTAWNILPEKLPVRDTKNTIFCKNIRWRGYFSRWIAKIRSHGWLDPVIIAASAKRDVRFWSGILYLEFLFLGLVAAIALALLAPFVVGVAYTLFAKPSGAVSTGEKVVPLAKIASGVRFSLRHAGPSLTIFKPGCEIRFLQVAIPGGFADLKLSTNYLDEWGDVQEALVAAVDCTAEETEEVRPAIARSLGELISVLSLSANAWVGDLVCVESGGLTEAALERRRERVREGMVRELDEEATGALLDRIGGFRDAAGLWAALADFRQALQVWGPAQKHIALAHLHNGLRLLSESFITYLAERDGLSRSGFAKTFGVQPDDLAAYVLRAELYRGDGIAFHTAQLAWQAVFQQDSGEIDCYVIEDALLSSTAHYFRIAIFKILELDEAFQGRLLQTPYDVPLGLGQSLFTSSRLREERILDRTSDLHSGPEFEM